MESKLETFKDLQKIMTRDNLRSLRQNRHQYSTKYILRVVGGKEKKPSEARGTYMWMNLLQTPLEEAKIKDDNCNGA